MKKVLLYLISVTSALLFSSFNGSIHDNISYTESSSGLQTMNLDGGRTEVEMADVNLDGFIDFLSIGDHGSPYVNTQQHGIMVWFGNGSGANWSLFQFGNFGYGGIAVGDVNNDGLPDVGYGMHHDYSSSDLGDQLLEAALGDGTGMNWTAWDDSLASQGETWGMFSTDFGDIDNDGMLDIGSVSFGCCAGVHVYKNLGTGTWRQTFGFTGGNSSMDFVFGDINNDGNLDFAVAQQNGTPYFGNGSGGFTPAHGNLPPPGNSGFKGVSLGDINNDGSKELAFITSSGGLNVWTWNTVSQTWNNLSTGLPSSSSYAATALTDMNMDGFADLVVFGAGAVTIWAGNGGTSWSQLANFTTHASPGSYSDFTVGDADNNGYPDLIIEAAESCGLFCTRNILRFFKETTPYSVLSITPSFPKGFERFRNNSVKFVEWVSSAPQGQISKVKLELSSTGSSGPWSLIADSLPNSGRYQWGVPASVNSTNCYIRHTVFIPGTSNTAVSLTPNPFIVGNLIGLPENNSSPGAFELYQNYPNPFNANTNFEFRITNSGFITLKVFDAWGREVSTLVNENMKPGVYNIKFDGTDLASGLYFYRLQADDFIETKKMVFVK